MLLMFILGHPFTISLSLLFLFLIADYYFDIGVDIPRIKGIPQVPGWPVVGNLFQLGNFHALQYTKWAEKYGPVYQVRLGNRRIIIANSFDAVRKLWIENQSTVISRPIMYTFHKLVSSTAGFTIGTTPWSESCKRKRKTAATALNKLSVQSYMPIVDLESYHSIRDLYLRYKNGETEFDIKPYFQRFALNTGLSLNYGTRLDSIDNTVLKEIVEVETGISHLRSHSGNYQDYLPFLRLLPFKKRFDADDLRIRRDIYLKNLLDNLKDDLKRGTDKPCITGNILKNPKNVLTSDELSSICLTMVSAGLDTVPSNLIIGIGHLANPGYGQQIQQRAYEEIMKTYPQGDAWIMCVKEEKIPYISALVKETLRHSSVIPLSLPRATIGDVIYHNSVIPKNTTMYMNAYAANHDETHYINPYIFDPERYLNNDKITVSGTPHFGYGAGSRMCAGSHLSNRELFIAFVRMILAFHIYPSSDTNFRMDPNPYNSIESSSALVLEPKRFYVKLEPRDKEFLETLLK